jgi:hypothetical protein
LGFSNPVAETVNFHADDGNITENSGVADPTEDEGLVFNPSGIRLIDETSAEVDIGLQIAGKPSNLGYRSERFFLQAIDTNTSSGACEPAFVNNLPITMTLKCHDPASCARPIYIRDDASTFTAVTSTF